MPELPEVETTLRGISPHIQAKVITGAIVRNPALRWPVSDHLHRFVAGRRVVGCRRRGKYLLLDLDAGHLLIHLGMSGSLTIVAGGTAPERHDHVDIEMASGQILRFSDPRRFGAVLWLDRTPEEHALLRHLGPEPLGGEFDGAYLYSRSRGRSQCVKNFIMNSRTVVGVGNIYAAEALFRSGIDPRTVAGRIGALRYQRLVDEIVGVLSAAIERGGTTLRDFVGGDGRPGYFRQDLLVYGRENQPCRRCGKPLAGVRLGNRATVFCRRCQR